MTNREELRDLIHRLHGAKGTYVGSVPVIEVFHGKVVWDGVVEVFDLTGHPKTHRAYAWSYETQEEEKRHVIVLHISPSVSPQTAVRAAIVPEPLQPAPKEMERSQLASSQAKAKIISVRFTLDELERIGAAAQATNQKLSEWIRSTLNAAIS